MRCAELRTSDGQWPALEMYGPFRWQYFRIEMRRRDKRSRIYKIIKQVILNLVPISSRLFGPTPLKPRMPSRSASGICSLGPGLPNVPTESGPSASRKFACEYEVDSFHFNNNGLICADW